MENIENTVCRSDSSFLGYSARNPLIIAELGTGHNGDRKKALELIDAASEAGTRCIKVQIVYADEILHPNTGTVMLPGGPVRLYDRFKSIEVSPDFFLELKEYSESKGLMFLATPFGLQSARELRALNPYAIKIASPELNHIPLLKEVASYGIPVILSSGVSTVADIEQAVTLLSASAVPLCLLHCVTAYPAPETAYNVRVLRSLNAIFGIPVGISDHSLDPYTVPVLAVAMGAAVIEKHFCLSRSDSGLDDPIALTPKDFAALVQAVTRAANTEPETVIAGMAAEKGAAFVNAVLGSGVKKLAAAEAENYGRTSRSIHAVRDLIPGTTLGESDITIVRTEKTLRVGVPPSFDVIGCTIKQFIPAGEGIRFEDLY
ncbi:MAG: N-acetylneuraminate synthase family protein [Treponema sp.]|nr:N-acetylneuraminate synthase family protein [Treponema sp.]